jgi:hypothetical protein
MNQEPSQDNKEDMEERHYVDTWDLDTVEFEISFVPWPLRWDAAKRILSWAIEPGYPPEEAEVWEGALALVRDEILEKSHTHVQVAQAIHKAFPLDKKLAEKGVKVVKYSECYLPKGYIH